MDFKEITSKMMKKLAKADKYIEKYSLDDLREFQEKDIREVIWFNPVPKQEYYNFSDTFSISSDGKSESVLR